MTTPSSRSAAGHTPGPWKAERIYGHGGSGGVHIRSEKNEPICKIEPVGTMLGNAALIAAAPDLLARLQELVECLGPNNPNDYQPTQIFSRTDQAILDARAAIAAATGGSRD